ncbi:MAG: glutamate mutase L [Acholeplasmataceae bacterium]
MRADAIVAEIGSTTTVVSAFTFDPPRFLGRGMAETTVDTDVTIGLRKALADLKRELGVEALTYERMFASSSAAGGLKITVHGLVYEMTARAAKEAALNAGANIHLITANELEDEHIERIEAIRPNMIVIAGGTDFGEKTVAMNNLLAVLDLNIPVIYAGNIANHDRIKALDHPLVRIVENVYPRVDDLNIMPLRQAIYETFEEHIIHAKGMERIFEMVDHRIIPTPGAVMDATMLLAGMAGSVMTIDVGGATTDVHSVAKPALESDLYHEGEPLFKRTVEGDLGVYVNRKNVMKTFRSGQLSRLMARADADLEPLIAEPFIPVSEPGKRFVSHLTEQCVREALDRHIGDQRRVFTTSGVRIIPDGRDTTDVGLIALTGGALIHDPRAIDMVRNYLAHAHTKLSPDPQVAIRKDQDYLFAAIGVLSHSVPDVALKLLRETLRWSEKDGSTGHPNRP